MLLNKIDRLPSETRGIILEKKMKEISAMVENSKVKVKKFYTTSIWDESLYQAWSGIVQQLIPNREQISKTLEKLCLASNIE